MTDLQTLPQGNLLPKHAMGEAGRIYITLSC